MSTRNTAWWDYVERHLDRRGMTSAELARQAGIDGSRLSRWKTGGGITVPAVRAVAIALGRPPVEALVAAGVLEDDEVRAAGVEPIEDVLGRVSTEDLLAEVRRRVDNK